MEFDSNAVQRMKPSPPISSRTLKKSETPPNEKQPLSSRHPSLRQLTHDSLPNSSEEPTQEMWDGPLAKTAPGSTPSMSVVAEVAGDPPLVSTGAASSDITAEKRYTSG